MLVLDVAVRYSNVSEPPLQMPGCHAISIWSKKCLSHPTCFSCFFFYVCEADAQNMKVPSYVMLYILQEFKLFKKK